MANYTACHIQFKLKDTVPNDILIFFNLLYNENDLDKLLTPEILTHQVRETICTSDGDNDIVNLYLSVYGVSSYHESWCKRAISEPRSYVSFASHKFVDTKMLMRLFTNLIDYLDCEDGDILVRTIYEDFPVENNLWVDIKNKCINLSEGIRYNEERKYMNDSRHPWHGEKNDDPYAPVMNRYLQVEQK